MASIRDVIAGLEVLAAHAKPMGGGAEGRDVHIGGAGHDVLCGPTLGKELTPVSKKILEEAGWHWDDEYDCWCRFC